MRKTPTTRHGVTPLGDALVIDCTCAHWVRDHDSGGCYAEGGMCHCEGKILYKGKGGEYMSIIDARTKKKEEEARRDELAANMATLNDDLRTKVQADAKRGITRLGRM